MTARRPRRDPPLLRRRAQGDGRERDGLVRHLALVRDGPYSECLLRVRERKLECGK